MVTTKGYMFFSAVGGIRWGNAIPRYAGVKKLSRHSFFGNPFYHWLSGHCNRSLVLFAQDLIVNCLTYNTT